MITITDILKNTISQNKDINNSLPFIIISVVDINKTQLLIKIPNISNNDAIWKLNYQEIYKTLNTHNVDPQYFAPLGDLWFNKNPTNANIILVNTNISQKPIDYIKIDNFNNLSIWKPLGKDGYNALGFIASIQKPTTNVVRLIPNIFLKEYHNTNASESRNINMNEYDLLATINEKYYTINKALFYNNDGDSNESWSNYSINGVTLMEDNNPWYIEKQHEHNILEPQETFIEDESVIVDDNNKTNYKYIICSFILFIALILGWRYMGKN